MVQPLLGLLDLLIDQTQAHGHRADVSGCSFNRPRCHLQGLLPQDAQRLGRIEAADYDVWAERVRVPTWRKLAVAARAVR